MKGWIVPDAIDKLPPDPRGGWFSPLVWLLLSDGQVATGTCLHRSPTATYEDLVHDWFVESINGEPSQSIGAYSLGGASLSVKAWQPLVPPEVPL